MPPLAWGSALRSAHNLSTWSFGPWLRSHMMCFAAWRHAPAGPLPIMAACLSDTSCGNHAQYSQEPGAGGGHMRSERVHSRVITWNAREDAAAAPTEGDISDRSLYPGLERTEPYVADDVSHFDGRPRSQTSKEAFEMHVTCTSRSAPAVNSGCPSILAQHPRSASPGEGACRRGYRC